MADETQVAPVAGAENATQEPTKTYVYYYSNPDGATKDERFHEVFTYVPFDVIPWRMHKEAPTDGMVDPVWDDKLNNNMGGWKENSGTAQGQILAEAQQAITTLQAKSEELDKKNAALDQANDKADQAIKAVQDIQKANAAQSLALTQGLQAVTKGQEQTNKVMAQMQQILLDLKTGQDKATQATPKADAPATQPTENTTDNK